MKKDNEIVISIIMPAYNCQEYIKNAINSVICQTYTNWELIIIDDCSQDDTWNILQSYVNKKIRIFRNSSNFGVAKTRNRGIALARGNWIAFLDSDDMWDNTKLAKQATYIEKNKQARLLYTGSSFIDYTGKKIAYILHAPEKIDYKNLLKQNLISCSSVLVWKEYMQLYKMPEMSMIHEDFAVWLQILTKEQYAYGIDEPLLIYRLSPKSKSGNKLKAAKMNWNTYRYVGINRKKACKCMFFYTVRGVLKYMNLRRNR